ncbi:MAG: MerR family DNA-binding transcriptional regulator [Acidimicrobiales bacterium]
MADTPHHSIGEVLAMLKEEHPDVTISKIRFFESQGLIDPERTPSGYRKFRGRHRASALDPGQQRDNFPLKVIKRRLEDAGFDPAVASAAADDPLPEPTLFTRADAPEPTGSAESEVDGAAAPPEPDESDESDESVAAEIAPDDPPETEVIDEPGADEEPLVVDVPPAPPIVAGDPLDVPSGSVSLSPSELAESAGVNLALVNELQRLGLIQTVAGGSGAVYDHEALVVARAAATFWARGVEPRHLRMFRVAADREAGVLEQLVGARLKKGGEAQASARAELNELVQLGETIHRSILRRSFGSQLD